MIITKAIHRQPTGFRDQEYRDSDVDVLGFAHGTIEDMSRISGTITGMMAVCLKDDRFEAVPISQLRSKQADIYIRRNGSFGASCDGTADTGHHITEDSGMFTVYSVDDPDKVIARDVTRHEAEEAIAKDWRSSK